MSPVKQLALSEGLNIEQPEKASSPEFVERMKALGVRVFAVAAFGQILREPLLGGLRCINVHASLLPKYRGAAPIERAIMAGERETGVSIMDITPKVDTGAVYMQRVVPIGEEDDAGSMYEKLGQAGGKALAEVLEAIERESMQPVPQDENQATYIEKISPADREIDWDRPAREIVNQVRALSPHIGAYTSTGDGSRLKVWKAAAAEADPDDSPNPGEIKISDGRIFAGCGSGAIELIEVQPEGKRRMDASDFIRGHGNSVKGKRFHGLKN